MGADESVGTSLEELVADPFTVDHAPSVVSVKDPVPNLPTNAQTSSNESKGKVTRSSKRKLDDTGAIDVSSKSFFSLPCSPILFMY